MKPTGIDALPQALPRGISPNYKYVFLDLITANVSTFQRSTFVTMSTHPDLTNVGRMIPLLSWILAIYVCLSSASLNIPPQQHPLLSNTAATLASNFSVGFSLQSSYGAAAIIFTYPDGQLETHTTVYYGNAQYREVMARLSLDSSIHIALDCHILISSTALLI